MYWHTTYDTEGHIAACYLPTKDMSKPNDIKKRFIDFEKIAGMHFGGKATSSITKSNAFSMIMNGLGYILCNNDAVDIDKVVIYASAGLNGLLLLDATFTRSADSSQDMLFNNTINSISGMRYYVLDGDETPAGMSFAIVYDITAPHKLEDGADDCGIYYHGGQSYLSDVSGTFTEYPDFNSSWTGHTKACIYTLTPKKASTDKKYFLLADDVDDLPTPVYGTAITPAVASTDWENAIELTSNTLQYTVDDNEYVLVVYTDSSKYPYAYTIMHLEEDESEELPLAEYNELTDDRTYSDTSEYAALVNRGKPYARKGERG